MLTMHEIFTQSDPNHFKEAARALGFTDLRLFKTEVDGVLGIYAPFDSNIADKGNVRCLALTYKLSQLMQCQIFIVTDRDQRIGREETVGFEEIDTEKFKEVFLASAKDIGIDSNTKPEYASKMISYGILHANFQSSNVVKSEEAQLDSTAAVTSQKALGNIADSNKPGPSLGKRSHSRERDSLIEDFSTFVSYAIGDQIEKARELIAQAQPPHKKLNIKT